MWRVISDWIGFSFKVFFAVLTAEVLILCMFLGGYTFCIVTLGLLGLL